MAIEDEIYMKYHVSQLRDLEDAVITLEERTRPLVYETTWNVI